MGKAIAGVDSDSVRELPSRFFTSGKTFNVLGIIFGGLLIVYGFLSIALSHFQGLVLGLWLVFFGLVASVRVLCVLAVLLEGLTGRLASTTTQAELNI